MEQERERLQREKRGGRKWEILEGSEGFVCGGKNTVVEKRRRDWSVR